MSALFALNGHRWAEMGSFLRISPVVLVQSVLEGLFLAVYFLSASFHFLGLAVDTSLMSQKPPVG
jgi:hypothetical protein